MSLLLLLGNNAPAPGPATPNRLRVNERPPMRQYILATAPSGRVERWGEDELEASDISEGLTESGSVPGGDKSIECSLPRKPGVDYSDMKVGTRVQTFGAGGKLLREGRLERAPRTSGDYLTMDPAAMGYQVLLTDDEGAREIFLDSDMSGWEGPSSARKLARPDAQFNANGDAQLLPGAAISHTWAHINSLVQPDVAESWYSGGGIELGTIIVDFVPNKGMPEGSAWHQEICIAIDSGGTDEAALVNFASVPTTQSSWPITAGFEFAFLLSWFAGEVDEDVTVEDQWRNIKVIGRSPLALPLRGAWPAVGFLASDLVPLMLSRWAPGVHYTTGPYGSIKASSVPILHLAFKEPTTVQEMITQALKYELLEWSVKATEEGPTFFLNPRGEREGRKRWRARVRPAKLTETGQQMDQVYNRAVVSFNGFDGKQHTVGAPRSGAEFTDVRCEDRDPLNPINEAGEDRTKHIALNDPATPEGGAEAAQRFLEQCKMLDGSGEATLTGFVEDEHFAEWPYYCVQEGDLIDFIDSSIPGYRYIVDAQATRSTRSVNVKIDAPPDSFEALMERLGARDAAAGIGS